MAAPAVPDPRGRARRRALVAAAVLLALFLLNGAWIVRSLRSLGGGAAGAGRPAPAFSGPTLVGPRLALADLRGQVVLLDFWATWCGPCLAEMPALRRLDETAGPRGLAVVGINIEGAAARRAVDDVVREAGLRYPTVLDEGQIRQLYGVGGLPHLVLIDREGIVRRVFQGATPAAEMARAVEETLTMVPRP
ncbi:MAG: TlpA family protein disulfide reductase [Deltaproteobacteria bacterium]|nr:TlpA family protein disulfide reductase [Deltaproteobacteria bacterium]